jgi:hypothetical protein
MSTETPRLIEPGSFFLNCPTIELTGVEGEPSG